MKTNKTIKVLIFHPTVAPYRIDLLNDLYKAFDTRICLYFENLLDQVFKYDEIKKKFEYIPTYLKHHFYIGKRRVQTGFIKEIESFNPDIVIVNEYSESYWIAMWYRRINRKNYKIISVCDDSEDMFRNDRSLHSFARNNALNNIDGVILCNEMVQKCYAESFPEVKTCVMPIIQDEERFFDDREWVINRANEIIDNENLIGKRVFLFVGRISPEKNIYYLIDSFIKQHKTNPENIMLLIGDYTEENQPYYQELLSSVTKSDADEYIRFIGRKEFDELKAWMVASQVLVLPSKREPFGAVVNEALICGCNVMVSNKAGSACLVDKSNGYMIDISNDTIDFRQMNEKVKPLMRHTDNIISKMTASYDDCINNLLDWICSFDAYD